MLRTTLLAGVATLAVAPAAFAQATSGGDTGAVSEVVVTGSRIVTNGFQQPTPVTVVGQTELQVQQPVTIAAYLNTLPSFGATTSARNPSIGVAGGGAENVNLRNLGVTRTLVLLDNRRVVDSAITGGVDTVTLPTSLIKRVEVVTGGASAAWGSDAVAGVVNFVLNHDYSGVGVDVESGISGHGDNQFYKIDVTAGRQFAGGRGRIVADIDYANTPEGVDLKDRDWFHSSAVVNNPAFTATNGQPRQITVTGAGPVNVSPGGVITAGPLKGIQFVGPNGTPSPYNFGNQSGLLQYGGDVDNSIGEDRAITTALWYSNAFIHADYDLTDKITAFAQVAYGHSEYRENGYLTYLRQGNITINSDNAYLDSGIRQQLLTRGLTNFTLGLDFTAPGPPTSYNQRDIVNAVVGLNGKLGESWKWNVYYTHGDAKTHQIAHKDVIIANFNSAVDAVRSPTTGAIVCRSTLTAPTNGCVPLNIFGTGGATAAALNYVLGEAKQKSDVQLDVVEADATGTLFKLPAGDLSVAFGVDYTNNKASATQNDLALNRALAVQNFQPFAGQRNVKEAFVEVSVPLLKDLPLTKNLEFNAAGRVTDYSTSGSVETWKIGLSDQITDDVRIRATKSRDIRAPTLNDLFSGGAFTQQIVFDPLTQKSYAQFTRSAGNPALQPEDADTTTVGLIYSPSFVPGLSLSIDYYKISIDGAISAVSAPQALTFCFTGQTQYCQFIHRDATNAITTIDSVPVNVASLVTEGLDYEVDYRHAVGPGVLSLRALASFVPRFTQVNNGVTTKFAGQVSDLSPGQPKWKASLLGSYEQGPFTISANIRYVGKAKLQNVWVSGVDVDNNAVPSAAIVSLTTVYRFDLRGRPSQLTFGIDNLFDKDPIQIPVVPSTVAYGAPGLGGRFDLYDPIGRSFRIGLRSKF
ncbi:TonB-dependent receptor plug domain-containing protein [Phenylobacterium sp.]|uniref:TonB-dependent receptor plug domain-containing protein n=1 Tax=Phenylobacterium sp. TaxID=1871053 RepID=UPI0035648A83